MTRVQRGNCDGVSLHTCGGRRLPVLFFIALVEVFQVADICGFDAHQAGETLHVFITEEQRQTGTPPSLPTPPTGGTVYDNDNNQQLFVFSNALTH